MERLALLNEMVEHYECLLKSSPESIGSVEKTHLAHSRRQIEKLNKLLAESDRNAKPSISTGDVEFANSFIDLFTMSAFTTEFAELNQTENGQFTSEDMATLAESIRTFALGIDVQDRSLFGNVAS